VPWVRACDENENGRRNAFTTNKEEEQEEQEEQEKGVRCCCVKVCFRRGVSFFFAQTHHLCTIFTSQRNNKGVWDKVILLLGPISCLCGGLKKYKNDQ